MTYTAEQYKTVLQEILNMLNEPALQKQVMAMLKDVPAMDTIMKAALSLNS